MAISKSNTWLAGLLGSGLEFYDFILYANFAPIIASLFFPTKNPVTSLLITFIVFATGFLVRPLGAIIFGYVGDHFGRKTALVIAMATATLPTLMLAFLPSYAAIGLAAPILLTILRILQGVAVSGELGSAGTFLVEHVADHRRGLAGSLIMGTAFLGILVGAIAATVTTMVLPTDALHAWGWRVPYLLGGILGVVGIAIRLRSAESPRFLDKTKTELRSPLKQVFLDYRKQIFLTVIVTSIMAIGNYILIAYVVTFLVKFQGFSLEAANSINLISLTMMVLLFPIMGIWSDKKGRKPIFKLGLYGFILFSVPIFWLLSRHQFLLALAGDLLLCVVLVPIAASIPTLLAELFPTQVRNSGTALGYNICLAIFGGTAPLVAMALVHMTGNNLAPAGYLIVCAILSSIALYFIDETHHKPLLN